MPVNIEIKARVRDPVRLRALAEALSGTSGTLLSQEDTFFNTPQGRLKLRALAPTKGELIYYERANATGPRPSRYQVVHTHLPDALKATLAAAMGIRGSVRKQRRLYRVGQTRVHLNEVEGLGVFVELEWVMQPGQTVEAGAHIVAELMQHLEVAATDLIAEAYIDLLGVADGAHHERT